MKKYEIYNKSTDKTIFSTNYRIVWWLYLYRKAPKYMAYYTLLKIFKRMESVYNYFETRHIIKITSMWLDYMFLVFLYDAVKPHTPLQRLSFTTLVLLMALYRSGAINFSSESVNIKEIEIDYDNTSDLS